MGTKKLALPWASDDGARVRLHRSVRNALMAAGEGGWVRDRRTGCVWEVVHPYGCSGQLMRGRAIR